MEEYRIFYSWQSDLPNSTNRSFIEKALENAAKAIRADDSIRVEPVIDRDTAGVPGAPDIATTIFTKIDQAQVFACDVSIINQGEKSRKTPNPNVLIELGYAIKTLGPERILMIMNTAFGPPEILPFDLSKKRAVTYRMPKECKDRATERKKLESQLDIALRTTLTKINIHTSNQESQGSLKKTCMELIREDNLATWIQLVDTLTDETITKLRAWRQTGEKAISQAQSGLADWEPWKNAVLEAVKLAKPCLVPILTAIQASKENYWREATSFLRRLAILRRDMGGSIDRVREIGESVLYVSGSLGMALAALTKQLNFIRLWAGLTLPEVEGQEQIIWCQIPEINYWQTGITGHINNQYGFILNLVESDDIQGLFPNRERFERSLFAGNLLHSLMDFHNSASQPNYEEELNNEYWRPNVMPVWCLMKPTDFKNEVWRIFGSSADVIKFAYPGIMPSAEKFWPLWQAWKKKCIQFMSDGGRYRGHLYNIYHLNLPGEIPIKTIR